MSETFEKMIIFLSGGLNSSTIAYVYSKRFTEPIILLHILSGKNENKAARNIARYIQRIRENVVYKEINAGDLWKGEVLSPAGFLSLFSITFILYPEIDLKKHRIVVGYDLSSADAYRASRKFRHIMAFCHGFTESKIEAPLKLHTKDYIVNLAMSTGVPIPETVSCELKCGECKKCIERKVALNRHGIPESF